MPFLQNVWYLSGWAHELADDALLARTIANVPLVFYRTEAGELAALFDRCPHRFAPLSIGRKQGNAIACGYHGLTFDASGACVHNPHGPVSRALCVQSYRCIERHEAIWVWLGDQSLADPALIPDMAFIDAAPKHAKSQGHIYAAANYLLGVDNIMDLSHVDFLHPTTLGGGALTRSKGKVSQDARTVTIDWEIQNDVAPPAMAMNFADPTAPSDVWTYVTWHPPGVLLLRAGAAPSHGPRSAGVDTMNVHCMTPETETTTHYFFGNTRNFKTDDATFNAMITEKLAVGVFQGEDKPMFEAQQRRIGTQDFFAMKPILLNIDAGSVAVRRKIEQMLAAEAHAPANRSTG